MNDKVTVEITEAGNVYKVGIFVVLCRAVFPASVDEPTGNSLKAVDNTAVANYFCLRQLPPSWTAWTDVTSCTVSCGNGTILRQAECRYNTGVLGDTW